MTVRVLARVEDEQYMTRQEFADLLGVHENMEAIPLSAHAHFTHRIVDPSRAEVVA